MDTAAGRAGASEPGGSRDWPGVIGSALAIAIGAGAFLASRDYSALGAVFPRTVGVLLMALGVLYIVFIVTGRVHAGSAPQGSAARRVAVALIMLGWGFTLGALGFLASSALAMVLLIVVAHHDRWALRTALLYGTAAGAVLVGLYGLFKHLLLVPLP
jgi:hypothetical protein